MSTRDRDYITIAKGRTPRIDPIQERIRQGMAINGAIALAAGGQIACDVEEIRAWRDWLYQHVILPPFPTNDGEGHYCIDHGQDFRYITNPRTGISRWCHKLPVDQGGWCLESEHEGTGPLHEGADLIG